jgi:hypothetical protein
MLAAKQQNKREIFRQTVFDSRLYGKRFLLITVFQYTTIILVQLFVQFFSSKQPLISFIPYCFTLFFLILISAFPSKNMVGKKLEEFHPFGSKIAAALIFLSGISIFFSFTFKQGDVTFYTIIDTVIFVFAEVSLSYTALNITVIGHRTSIIDKLKISETYFTKTAEKWHEELADLASKKVLDNLNQGKYIVQFFERGSFDLVVLWSCSIISNIVNITTEPIIARHPEKKELFRRIKISKIGDNLVDFERCPIQLSNLGFDTKKYNLERIWEKRNDIAHRNVKPSFSETVEALNFFVAFSQEMPKLLKEQC